MVRFDSCRQGGHDEVSLGEVACHVAERKSRIEIRGKPLSAFPTPQADHVHAELLGHACHRTPDLADADQHHGLFVQLLNHKLLIIMLLLLLNEPRQSLGEGEHAAKDEL